MVTNTQIVWQDVLALVLYFAVTLAVGFYASCRANPSSTRGYFLAGMNSNWFLIGMSTFATNIGSPTFTGLPSSAAASGIAVVIFEWQTMIMMVALGWVFLPVYRACGCFTMPQYLKLRYGGERIRLLLATLSMFGIVIVQIAGQMYSGALFIQQSFRWNLYVSVGVILAVTALYTITGGLTAVMWTDTLQSFIIIIGSLALSIIALQKVGGWEGITQQYPLAAANYTLLDVARYGNHTCGLPRKDWDHIFRSVDSDYPWPGLIGGVFIIATNAWCTDQVCVQRSLSAKSLTHAKAGLLLTGFLKFLPFLLYIIPGLISRILYPNEIACADPNDCTAICGNPSGCSNIAYPLLVMRILPIGVRGLMLAALLAALMSSLTSIFNSSSTLFTIDIYRRFRPRAKSTELMVVGRFCILVLVGVSILWLPVLDRVQGSQIWNYFMEFASYTVPPVVAAFYWGIFWKRTTEAGAFWGMLVGLVMGVIRVGLSWSDQAPPCGDPRPDNRPAILTKVHFLHYSMISLAVCSVVMVMVSCFTKPRSPAQLRRVTFCTRLDLEPQEQSELEQCSEGGGVTESLVRTSSGARKGSDFSKEETGVCTAGTSATSNIKIEGEAPIEEQIRWRDFIKSRLLKYFCGVQMTRSTSETAEKILEMQRQATNIQENPKHRRILNCVAVVAVAICIGLHAFFA